MDLVVECTLDNMENKSKVDVEWLIKNIRYRKHIATTTLVEYFYKKMGNNRLYLRDIKNVKYVINKR